MKNKNEHLQYSSILNRYTLILALVWTLAIGISLSWNYINNKDDAEQAAIITVRTQLVKDVIYRRWNAEHGGVYAAITEKSPPNPYLTQVRERDIKTPSGRKLTLINPAYMTRQVHELGLETEGILGHITSLKPIRPENIHDAWEKKALMSFEKGQHEYFSIEMLNNSSYLRLMRPLKTEKECLKCHAQQGYKEGDIRGGISISIPMTPYMDIADEHMYAQIFVHIILLLLGFAGITLGARKVRKNVVERDHAISMLEQKEERLAYVLEGTNAGTWDWNIQNSDLILDSRWANIMGQTLGELAPIDINTLRKSIHPDDFPIANASLERHIKGETDFFDVEFRQPHKDGSWIWVNARGKVIEWNADGKAQRMSGIHLDITERKRSEEALEKAFQEKQYLLQELQHRAKNSFTLILSLIDLAISTSESTEAQSSLTQISSRIMAVSKIYDLLYMADSVYDIQLEEYLSRVTDSLKEMSLSINIKVKLDTITVPVKFAIPIGIIVTELITNSIKYAFPGNQGGTIKLSMEKTDTGAAIEVTDDGTGLPKDFDISATGSLGLSLVEALTRQIKGSFKIEGNDGTRSVLEFPINDNNSGSE